MRRTAALLAAGLATACIDSTAPTLPVAPTIVAGASHTCRLARDGVASCWGQNYSGQLGNGSTMDASSPVPVAGGFRFVAISAGGSHTCGIVESGAAYCWGQGELGQLGNGSVSGSPVPVPVSGDFHFIGISAGLAHTCAVTNDGTAYCWGHNVFGRLGDSTTSERSVPNAVAGGLRFRMISAGGFRTCALTLTGKPYCWGRDVDGELGIGPTTPDNPVPRPVIGSQTFVAISAGWHHTCALTFAGAAYCWGDNGLGQVGTPPPVAEPVTAPVSPVFSERHGSFSEIHASRAHTCAVTGSGAAYCWGTGAVGQAGSDTIYAPSPPLPVAGGLQFTALSVGSFHTCGLTTQGTYCWGENRNGQVGQPVAPTITPAPVVGLVAPVSIVSGPGAEHTCALNAGGSAFCWGYNRDRQLGTASASTTGTPTAVGGLTFSQVSPALTHTCGVKLDGAAYCWGDNNWGQGGDGTLTSPLINPAPVAGGHTFTAVSAGNNHSCGLTDSGKAYCWGLHFALGDSLSNDSNIPVPVAGGLTFVSIGAGNLFTCALTSGGTAYCWGLNGQGQLGDSTNTAKNYPVAVQGGLTFTALSVGFNYACGIATGGAAYCWGYNDADQFGSFTAPFSSNVPLPVSGGLTFSSIAAGIYHTCGLTTTGAAYCWGVNNYGEVGTDPSGGTLIPEPTPVTGGLTFASITAGYIHTCGMTTSGGAYCWGDNFWGQLGRGTVGYFTTPVLIAE